MQTSETPLEHFKEQFTFLPSIINSDSISSFTRVVVCGMGGSAISVSLLKLLFPELPITLHNTYGLPVGYDAKNTLLIINSYSGNTEEALDAFNNGKKCGANMVVLSLGGLLIQMARDEHVSYIQLPESSLEPRFSIGHQIIGLLTFMGEVSKIEILKKKIELLDLVKADEKGKELSKLFINKFPVLYSSQNLYPISYLIKAAINEGAKTPAFVNQIPEANHNELQSFVEDENNNTSDAFGFLFLVSTFDHVRIQKRFSLMETMYKERGFTTSTIVINHTDILESFSLIIAGYYMATYMAKEKNLDPYKTPFIAEFKKRILE